MLLSYVQVIAWNCSGSMTYEGSRDGRVNINQMQFHSYLWWQNHHYQSVQLVSVGSVIQNTKNTHSANGNNHKLSEITC